jgi:uncharacterized membrane protein
VPFERIWPWSGTWNDLPAAHAAAVLFDLGTFFLLVLLGYRIRPGPAGARLGAILGFGWAAYPYTAYVLESNSNDSLVALLLVATLLVLARPIARGALAALAALTKFAPILLAPMLMTYRSPAGRPQRPAAARFAVAFLAASALVLLWPAIEPGLHVFYDRTVAYQENRDSPFSIWGQAGLEPLRIAIGVAVLALALLLAFRPREKSLAQIAAFGTALLIGAQLTAQHWFYLYIVWFYPLLLVALATAVRREPGPSPARSSPPAPPR